MKVSDIKKNILYIVIKSSTDLNIQKGDLIWISENNDLNNKMYGGPLAFLHYNEWNIEGMNDFECEVSDIYYLDIYNGYESIKKLEV